MAFTTQIVDDILRIFDSGSITCVSTPLLTKRAMRIHPDRSSERPRLLAKRSNRAVKIAEKQLLKEGLERIDLARYVDPGKATFGVLDREQDLQTEASVPGLSSAYSEYSLRVYWEMTKYAAEVMEGTIPAKIMEERWGMRFTETVPLANGSLVMGLPRSTKPRYFDPDPCSLICEVGCELFYTGLYLDLLDDSSTTRSWQILGRQIQGNKVEDDKNVIMHVVADGIRIFVDYVVEHEACRKDIRQPRDISDREDLWKILDDLYPDEPTEMWRVTLGKHLKGGYDELEKVLSKILTIRF